MRHRASAVATIILVSSVFVAIYSGVSSHVDDVLNIEEGGQEEVAVGSGGRRSLLSKKWKARKMCPPGLDICRDEEKRKAEEIADRRKAKEEREKEEAKELEELSEKVSLL